MTTGTLVRQDNTAQRETEHRLLLAPAGCGAFSVTFDGETIVKRSHAPEAAAACVLVARGITGRAVTCHRGSPTPCLRFDLKQMAHAAERKRQDREGRLRGRVCRNRVARPRANAKGRYPPSLGPNPALARDAFDERQAATT